VRALLDTSIVVGLESGRSVPDPPEDAAVSVITLEELALGVEMAALRGDDRVSAQRRLTLDLVATRFEVLPVTRAVALACARIRAAGRAVGVRYPPFDAVICATAHVHGLQLLTQDAELATVAGLDVRVV